MMGFPPLFFSLFLLKRKKKGIVKQVVRMKSILNLSHTAVSEGTDLIFVWTPLWIIHNTRIHAFKYYNTIQ